MTEMHDRATALLWPIWQGLDPDYKSKYRATIWRQFEDQIRSAAYTTTLSLFLSRICSRLSVSLRDDALQTIRDLVSCGHDREMLRIFRDESAYCVTIVRLTNDERRERSQQR